MESPIRPGGSCSGPEWQGITAGVAEIIGGWFVEVAGQTFACLRRNEPVVLVPIGNQLRRFSLDLSLVCDEHLIVKLFVAKTPWKGSARGLA